MENPQAWLLLSVVCGCVAGPLVFPEEKGVGPSQGAVQPRYAAHHLTTQDEDYEYYDDPDYRFNHDKRKKKKKKKKRRKRPCSDGRTFFLTGINLYEYNLYYGSGYRPGQGDTGADPCDDSSYDRPGSFDRPGKPSKPLLSALSGTLANRPFSPGSVFGLLPSVGTAAGELLPSFPNIFPSRPSAGNFPVRPDRPTVAPVIPTALPVRPTLPPVRPTLPPVRPTPPTVPTSTDDSDEDYDYSDNGGSDDTPQTSGLGQQTARPGFGQNRPTRPSNIKPVYERPERLWNDYFVRPTRYYIRQIYKWF